MNKRIEKVHPHPNCLLCGKNNPRSLGLTFRTDGDGSVSATFKGHDEFQGYDGIMHGGVIAALLDSAMTNCLFSNGIRALTGELNVRYRNPVPASAEIELNAGIVSVNPPLYILKASLVCNNRIMAKASAKFMKIAEK